MDGLAVAPNDASNIALAELDLENGHFSARDFSEHHVVRKFDQLADHKLEKLFHSNRLTTNGHESTRIFAALILDVSALEVFSVFAHWADFRPVRFQKPKPIVTSAADKIAMLLDQKMIAIFP